MRNPLLALIACCTLIAPFQAAACACADTYVDGGYIELPNPPYPEHARLKNEQGIVKLRVRVAPNNRIRLVEVAESSGSPLLDEAAVAAVHQYRFQAALLCEQRQPENVSILFPLRRFAVIFKPAHGLPASRRDANQRFRLPQPSRPRFGQLERGRTNKAA